MRSAAKLDSAELIPKTNSFAPVNISHVPRGAAFSFSLPILTLRVLLCAERNSLAELSMLSGHPGAADASVSQWLWPPFVAAVEEYAVFLLDPHGRILSWN